MRIARVCGLLPNMKVGRDQERLDLPNESSCRGIRIPDEEQNQNHPDEWNQSRDNYDGIENVRGRALAQIRIMADQFERNDGADS